MKEVDNKDVDWIHLTKHSVLCPTHISTVMNLQFPYNECILMMR